MNRSQFPNWQYGYTLGPATEANRGDYQVYRQAAGAAAPTAPLPHHHQQHIQTTQTGAAAADVFKQPHAPQWLAQQQQQQPNQARIYSNLRYVTPTSTPPAAASSSSNNMAMVSAQQGSNASSFSSGPKSWKEIKPNVPSTFKAKVFVTASPSTLTYSSPSTSTTSSTAEADDDPPYLKQSLAQLHDLAVFNNVTERFEQSQEPASKMFSVTLHLGTEKYQGTGLSLKAAKQVRPTRSSHYSPCRFFGGRAIAHWLEAPSRKRLVRGSNPVRGLSLSHQRVKAPVGRYPTPRIEEGYQSGGVVEK